jgi:hypothetical protein
VAEGIAGPQSLTAMERSREAMRRNLARRSVIGIFYPANKWCSACMLDKELDDFHVGSSIFGRASVCTACMLYHSTPVLSPKRSTAVARYLRAPFSTCTHLACIDLTTPCSPHAGHQRPESCKRRRKGRAQW